MEEDGPSFIIFLYLILKGLALTIKAHKILLLLNTLSSCFIYTFQQYSLLDLNPQV